MQKILYALLLIFLTSAGFAQTTRDAAVPLVGNVQYGPLRVELSWPAPTTTADILLIRREKDSTTWFVLLNQTGTTTSSFSDPFVTAGKVYEYGIQRTVNGVAGFGYLSVALEKQPVDARGQVLVFCEEALSAPLASELERLRQDLTGDGWSVKWHEVPASATVANIKSQIVADYNAAPQQVKSVLLLGAIPVPYSGNTAWDAHTDHAGAWPADTYYGDVNGTWTDNSVNNTSPARPENDNIPGDGKYDQSFVPTESELAVGRVDFSSLSEATFGAGQVELMRRYLNKNHRWRVKEYTVDNKVLVDDNFGYFNSEAFAANGYRNGYALVGESNIVDGDFFTDTDDQNFLFGYGCGAGSYTSVAGVGTSTDFATDSVNVVFSMLFGSYNGDWDYSPDPILPAALASRGGILTVTWAGRPHWFFQHMNAGETIGYSSVETQNACDNLGYPNYYGACGTHSSLLGDPTLRAHIVAPATNLVLTPQCGSVKLDWTPSADAGVTGYNIYRSTSPYSGYTKINTALVNGSYTDMAPPADTLYYQVRAMKMQNTIAGSYWNNSTGVMGSLIYNGNTLPNVSADGGLITCYNEEDTLRGFSNTPDVSFSWTGPNGFTANTQNAPTSVVGSYTLVVTAPNGCTAAATVSVVEDVEPPIVSTANTEITCTNASVMLPAEVIGGEPFWDGPNGFSAFELNPVVDVPGVYTLTALNLLNGCTATGTVNVLDNTQGPDAGISASGTTLTCALTTINLFAETDAPGATYAWTGPGGTSDDPEWPVSAPGQYDLVVTDPANGCTSETSITIDQDITQPDLQASGATLSCNDPQVVISASSNTPNVTYAWSGPGGFASVMQNPMVSNSGSYTVLVTAPNGCTATATVEVDEDGSLPNVSASGGLITCYNDVDTLRGMSDTPGVTYSWTGPGGFSSNLQNPVASAPGIYELVVTALNGCTNSKEVFVIEDTEPPIVSANFTGAISCISSTVQLNGSVAGGDAFWEGPNGFFSTDLSTPATDPGEYVLTGFNPLNGCTGIDILEVPADTLTPALTPVGGILYCEDSEVALSAIVGPDVIVAWPTLPGGDMPVVTIPGSYEVVATDLLNGCTATAFAEVTQVQPFLTMGLASFTLNCSGALTLSATPEGGTPPYSYSWNNGETGQTTTFPYGTNLISCTVTDEAGCMQDIELVVTDTDTLAINVSATNESAAGANDGSATATVLSGDGPFNYEWSNGGNTATISNLPGGEYTVTVTSQSTGCTSVATIVVETSVSAQNPPDGWQVALAPNPAGDYSRLDLRLPQSVDADIVLTNLEGRTLRTIYSGQLAAQQIRIDLNDLPTGMYLVRIRTAMHGYTLRLIKAE